MESREFIENTLHEAFRVASNWFERHPEARPCDSVVNQLAEEGFVVWRVIVYYQGNA